jgi:OOP family OmpA-OmpF porin
LILQGVIFEHDSNLLAAASKMILDNLASQLISQKMQRRIQVVGHTDAAGPAAYNQKLSKKRAEAVHDYLVSQGVDAAILSAVGKGELQPIADNTTDAGRAENRRVELHWE